MTDSIEISWPDSSDLPGEYYLEQWTPRGDGSYDVEVRRAGDTTVLRRYVSEGPLFKRVYVRMHLDDKTAAMVGDRKL